MAAAKLLLAGFVLHVYPAIIGTEGNVGEETGAGISSKLLKGQRGHLPNAAAGITNLDLRRSKNTCRLLPASLFGV
jgi:cation transporter-like permease